MAQGTSNATKSVSGTSSQIVTAVAGRLRRTSLLIVNTSAAAVVTIAKGDITAVAGVGIVLQPTGLYVESNSENFTCWQGAIQAVSTVAGSVAIVESWESD